jgi:ubiquinone/menaquinone biosynthesis C-methylase UbiE
MPTDREPPTSPPRPGLARHENEIQHWSRLAEEADGIWGWDTPVGRRRAERRAALLIEHGRAAPGRSFLELGCGTGTFTTLLAGSGARIVAVDISEELIRKGRDRCRRAGLPTAPLFERASIEALPHAERTFDGVLGSSVLHHVELEPAIAEIFRVLRPGGRLALAEPNMMNPQIFIQKNVPPIKRWVGDSPDETAFFRWSLAKRLHAAGFVEVAIEPYDFLHPAVPERLIGSVSRFGQLLEKLPVFREIAGSLIISATRPS